MPVRKPLYIETSVWSAVIDRRIRGRQHLTRRFLRAAGRRRRLLVSDLALAELNAHPRLEIRKGIGRYLRRMRPRVLGPSLAVKRATETLMSLGGWGSRVIADVAQLCYALVAGAEGFVTWNQRDLARDRVRDIVTRYCQGAGIPTMRVGTPVEVAVWLGLRIET